jgi:hypothetical protein
MAIRVGDEQIEDENTSRQGGEIPDDFTRVNRRQPILRVGKG